MDARVGTAPVGIATSPVVAIVPEESEGELMRRTAAGDRDAFAGIVERYQGPLVRYLGRLCGSRERAEDLAQEAFLRLFKGARAYRDRDRLAAYLFRIATNLLRSEERRRRRWHRLVPLLGTVEAAEPAAPRDLYETEAQARLRDALADLPLVYRVPLVLFELEEWSHAEIARFLGCREGTVKSRIFRARARLRDALSPWWQEGPP